MDQEILENLYENMFQYSEQWNFSSSNTSPPTVLQYSSYVLSIVTCIIGLPANILVIFITGFLMKKNKYKTWFLNLALADFSFLLFLPLHAVYVIRQEWPYGASVCKFYTFFTAVNSYAGIYILTALNIDRALSVAKPIWHRRFYSRRFCWCMCAAIWVSSALCSIPAIVYSDVHKGSVVCGIQFRFSMATFSLWGILSGSNTLENSTAWRDIQVVPTEPYKHVPVIIAIPKKLYNTEEWTNDLFALTGLVVPLVVVGYIIPLCVILVSNIIIALHVKNSKMAATSRLYRVVIVAVMSFFCVKTPSVCAYITLLVSIHSMQSTLAYNVVSILPLLYSISATNSLLNPMVYVLVGNQVRTEIKNTLKKRCKVKVMKGKESKN